MTVVAITQRMYSNQYSEVHDALSRKWWAFFDALSLTPLIMPNHIPTASKLLDYFSPSGLIISGGGDLYEYGGDFTRDALERQLLIWCINHSKPVIGVCHGMQLIQSFFGGHLIHVENHILERQLILFEGQECVVNSYHRYGMKESIPELTTLAVATDGVIKAVKHRRHPIYGIMWHPERRDPFEKTDMALFSKILRGECFD